MSTLSRSFDDAGCCFTSTRTASRIFSRVAGASGSPGTRAACASVRGLAAANRPASSGEEATPPNKAFICLLAGVQLCVLVAFQFTEDPAVNPKPFSPQLYNYYIGVSLMMFVGFGYLMTFLRWYGLGAVGLTMLITALGVEVSLLIEPLVTPGASYRCPINPHSPPWSKRAVFTLPLAPME